jgi:methyl-accepting chemotaxis protein
METPTSAQPVGDSAIDDRRKSDRGELVSDRRKSPRTKRLKGAQIIWPNGVSVKCVVRNLSEKGAKIVIPSPVPGIFDLVFDHDQSRRSCRVVWRKEIHIGVQFI